MSTLSVTNLKNAASATNNLVLNPDGSVNISGGTLSPQTGFKNRLINGDMRIDQRNAGASVTIGGAGNLVYTLDRWAAYCDQNSKFSVQQDAGAVTPPVGFTDYLGVTSLSAYSVGASEAFGLQQAIEGFNTADLGWGTANAKTVTLSFQVRSSLTGTFGGALRNSANNRSYPFTYTVSAANTWEQKSITIAGDTTGTWLTTNGAGIKLWFSLGAGSTFSGTASAWAASNLLSATGATSVVGTSGATFYITGVQLERGSTATPFEFRSIGTELGLCQRYFQKSYNLDSALGTNEARGAKTTRTFNTDVFLPIMETRLLVSMRATPAITWYTTQGTAGSINVGAGTNTVNTIYDTSMNSTGWMYVNGSVASGDQITGHFAVSSEL
jgi:hypothetical protein